MVQAIPVIREGSCERYVLPDKCIAGVCYRALGSDRSVLHRGVNDRTPDIVREVMVRGSNLAVISDRYPGTTFTEVEIPDTLTLDEIEKQMH